MMIRLPRLVAAALVAALTGCAGATAATTSNDASSAAYAAPVSPVAGSPDAAPGSPVAAGVSTPSETTAAAGPEAEVAAVASALTPRTYVTVGDSVMYRLTPTFASVAAKYGSKVVNAAQGSCAAMAVTVLEADGTLVGKRDCAPIVRTLQDKAVAANKPDAVIWWSRYELADRRSGTGARLRAGTAAWWQAQNADLARNITRLTRTGAKLVFVTVDRLGVGYATHRLCLAGHCHPFILRLRDAGALRRAWNARLRAVAAKDSRVVVIGMEDLYCRTAKSPCVDRLPLRTRTDTLLPVIDFRTSATLEAAYAASAAKYFPRATSVAARTDGVHFAPGALPGVASVLLRRADAALATTSPAVG